MSQQNEKKKYFEVFTIQEYVADKQIKNRWIRVGTAFPNSDGSFNLSLNIMPLPEPKTGKIQMHMRLPFPKDTKEFEGQNNSFPSNFEQEFSFEHFTDDLPEGSL